MELKFDNLIEAAIDNGVSIVPLWNWNLREGLLRNDFKCINRTFMELKFPNSYFPAKGW